MHLHIAGLGPAGSIVALRAAARGWDVTAYDPRVRTEGSLPRWPATYGALVPELPSWSLPYFSTPFTPRILTYSDRPLSFEYAMLYKPALRAAVESCGARIVSGHIPESVRSTAVVIDCTGAPSGPGAFWQVAVGIVLPHSLFSDANSPIFMDWRRPRASPSSFLYIQPTDAGILWEETVLATRTDPKQLIQELTVRLESRLDQDVPGWRECADLKREIVTIPMGTRKGRAGSEPHYFGAAGGLINPATGYSVGAAFAQVDALLDGIAEPRAKASRRQRIAERANAELARALRRIGAELISQADHATLRDFFNAFFQLSVERQLAYLTGHDGLGVAKTMWALRTITGFNHPFLLPIWKRPGQMLRVGFGK